MSYASFTPREGRAGNNAGYARRFVRSDRRAGLSRPKDAPPPVLENRRRALHEDATTTRPLGRAVPYEFIT